jgi:hypothetical protein
MGRMPHNGPAIWGGCVTRRTHRAVSWYPEYSRPESCHGARRVWHVFLPSWYKFYCILARSRYKFDRSCEFIPGYKVVCGHWPRVLGGTSYLGARNLSRCRILIACRCACPGARVFTNLSWVQEQSKNRDKQLTHIVRVRFS